MSNDASQPLYQQIYQDLIAGIRTGTWKDGDRLPSEKELADQYHVSRITSKKALEMLSTAGCIQRIPGKGSFVQQGASLANALSGESGASATRPGDRNRPLLIGLIMPDFDATYGIGLLSGVEKACAEQGIFLILRRSYGDQKMEERSIEEVMLLGVDGILIMPVHGEHYAPKILRLILEGFPLVFVDRRLRGLNAPFVGTDNLEAARRATDYLLDAGHRCISLLSPSCDHNTAIEDRTEGFVKSHAAHGIAIDESLWLTNLTATLPGLSTPDGIQRDIDAIQELVRGRKEITCLFAAEYNIALLAASAVRSLGLRIPEDIALVCFDSPGNFMHDHAFTHLRQRETYMGETAVGLLLRQIRREPGPSESILLEADLVLGSSTENQPAETSPA